MKYKPPYSNPNSPTSMILSIALAIFLAFIVVPFSHAQTQVKTSKKIEIAAKDSLGKEMWGGFGLKSGHLGCAASVSNVLNKAGVKYIHSAATKYMRNQILKGKIKVTEHVLKNGGTKPVSDKALLEIAKPGDVLVAFMDPLPRGNIGPKAHCGIMGAGGKVYTNDWNDGKWKYASIHRYFDSYKYMRVLRFH